MGLGALNRSKRNGILQDFALISAHIEESKQPLPFIHDPDRFRQLGIAGARRFNLFSQPCVLHS